MTPIKRRVAMISAPVLLALSLTACGGGAPSDASVKDFCEAYNSQGDALGDIDPEASEEEQGEALVDALKDYADKLEEVGTPEDMPDDARDGFELQLDVFADVNADDLEDEDFEDQFSDEENDSVEALTTYVGEECGADSSSEAPE